MVFTNYEKNGTVYTVPEVNVAKYQEIWKTISDNTIKEVEEKKSHFKEFADKNKREEGNLTFLFSIPDILSEFNEFLIQKGSFDSDQIDNILWDTKKEIKKLLIKNLEKEIEYTFDVHSREVLAQYYVTSSNKDSWNDTIIIIECLKKMNITQI